MGLEGPYVRRLRPTSSTGGSMGTMLLLACFSSERRVLTAAQIAAQLELLPATVEMLASNLVSLHCLDRDDSGAYMLAETP